MCESVCCFLLVLVRPQKVQLRADKACFGQVLRRKPQATLEREVCAAVSTYIMSSQNIVSEPSLYRVSLASVL